MLAGWVIFLVSLGYILLLFALAYYGDKKAGAGKSLSNNPYIYALSLAVYCTAWTFFGSVGLAANSGVMFLTIYLGPTLMVALWWFVLRKMIRIAKVNHITSIADFIASRYGKSSLLGGLVTVVAVIGIIPYISLQLRAISVNFTVLRHYPNIVMPADVGTIPVFSDTAFFVALLLAAFAILFGTRHLDATEHHEGLVLAIAFESVVKLVAFLLVGIFVTYGIYYGSGNLFERAAAEPKLAELFTLQGSFSDWAWLTFLSMMAILFLPRQFQMAVIENNREEHLNKAIWLFPLYLIIINLFVLPIALGGLLHFPDGSVNPDTFVLTLPMAERREWLALFVFIGGLSAATGMVIVATVALTTMVSNTLIMPFLLRIRVLKLESQVNMSNLLLFIRRAAIVLILLLSYGYFRQTGQSSPLVSIGLISFTAVAQFAPAVLGGMYWKGGTRIGALVGITGGFLVWAYTLFLPSMAESGWFTAQFIEHGPFGIWWLKPYALFGVDNLTPITHALVWSMLFNVGGYLILSLLNQPTVLEHSQASLFVDVFKYEGKQSRNPASIWRGSTSVESLRSLLGRFLGPGRADRLFAQYAQARGLIWTPASDADPELVGFAEKQLAGVIGAASARVTVASVVKEEMLSLKEVMDILDETSQVIAYSHQLEEKSQALEKATAELRAANEELKKLDRLKDEFISTVTHELRTPLTSIRAFSEILSDNPDLNAAKRLEFSGIILKESERLTRLINNVLDLAKIESGNMEWSLSAVDIRDLIKETVTAVAQLLHEKNARLELDFPDHVPSVRVDHDRIMQVLLNLASNAIKFCAVDGGRIQIQVQVLPDALQVNVSDNGAGIAPENRDIIFEKFRQAGDTLTDKPQGTGLGLPICRRIVSYFGGEIWVSPRRGGSGVTFSFTLPFNYQPVINNESSKPMQL